MVVQRNEEATSRNHFEDSVIAGVPQIARSKGWLAFIRSFFFIVCWTGYCVQTFQFIRIVLDHTMALLAALNPEQAACLTDLTTKMIFFVEDKACHLYKQLTTIRAAANRRIHFRDSRSPWAFPVTIVPKADGQKRLCVDYRRLNALTIDDKMPLPNIQEVIDRLQEAKYFTSLDIASGY
ncbi:hypothetical protein LAZ67_13001976 [Cordylochernes scorpioides]|uniref:Reverse transcriptase n=1 Tax=Cordylochernes scorpioides TaxID=51811 RepID=A0ABY6L495_9ARAC|nr:hypothetical protein LAZ67_13001976 [Cordylochernes scorpioides]